MEIKETKLPGVFIIEPKVFSDSRGWFMESWSLDKFAAFNLSTNFVQDNHSFTKYKGTLRGIHFQNEPYAQAKLVRVVKGKVLDLAVDLRKDSPTYKQWIFVELSSKNKKQLFIPKGFGHGFLTLTNNVEFVYKCDNVYRFEFDRGIRFDDPSINIEWNIEKPILSEKDSNLPFLESSDCNLKYSD